MGTLDDGSEFDSSRGRSPLEFTVGSGQVIPGFDGAVVGLETGDSARVTLDPADAYGPRLEEAAQSAPREMFQGEPVVGGVVDLIGPSGETIRATICGIDDNEIALDFNHPLAGERLTFEIEVVEVVESS